MSKDNPEDGGREIVKEETAPTGHSDVPGPKPPGPPENPGEFRDLFEDMWGSFEDPQDSKKE